MTANTTILHSEIDETVPDADILELLSNSGLPQSPVIVAGTEHRLAEDEWLEGMLKTVENRRRNDDNFTTT